LQEYAPSAETFSQGNDYCPAPDVHTLKFCILDIIAYLFSFLWFNWFEEIYVISTTLQKYTQLLSALVIFFIVIAFMWILTQFTVRVEEAINKKAQFD